jgi:hypothetical protein
MPQRFYQAPKKSRAGLFLIIVLGLILIGGLAAFAIYLSGNLKINKQAQPDLNSNQNEQINTNQPSEPEVPTNQNVNDNINVNSNLNANINENVNINSNINENINLNSNLNLNTNKDPVITPLPSAPDIDADGLTAAEESLFGTNPELNDTDGDGYSDGAELLNGYDPTKPQLKLSESDLFSTYNHSLYSIIYPKGWEAKARDQQNYEVLFSSATGEFVEILIVENGDNLSLNDWYKKQYPDIDLAQARLVTINNLSGLRHPDNQSYFLTKQGDNQKIFLLMYNTGNIGRTSFNTVFQVMAKSLRLLP